MARISAPDIAPVVVAISKNIPAFILMILSLRYAEAAPDDVAITDTILAPIAVLISMLNSKTSIGIIIIPPPTPTNDPIIPAIIDTTMIIIKNDNI